MNALMFFLPVLLLAFIIYKVVKSHTKYLLELKLVSQYDKIELYVIKNRTHLSNVDIKFLEANKNISVNPQYLDIRFIMAINHMMKDKKIQVNTKWYSDYVNSEGSELRELLDSYKNTQVTYSLLSTFKTKFIIKVLWVNLKKFVNNRALGARETIKNKIESALYSGNNIGKMAGC